MTNDTSKYISYGKANGIIILVGEKMGYKINYKEQAIMLSQGDSIEPIYMGAVEKEASRINSLMARDGMTDEANKIALTMFKNSAINLRSNYEKL